MGLWQFQPELLLGLIRLARLQLELLLQLLELQFLGLEKAGLLLALCCLIRSWLCLGCLREDRVLVHKFHRRFRQLHAGFRSLQGAFRVF